MKKILFLHAVACLLMSLLFLPSCNKSSHVSLPSEKKLSLVREDSARAIAVNFNPNIFYGATNSGNHSSNKSPLNGNNRIQSEFVIRDSAGVPAIYIYNFTGDAGFVYVSADYNMNPLLGYVERGIYGSGTVPGGLKLWLRKTLHDIAVVRRGLYDNAKSAAAAWKDYAQQNHPHTLSAELPVRPATQFPPSGGNGCTNLPPSTYFSYGPSLPTTWGQQCTYNDLCPNFNCGDCGPLAATGCVATAIAQITRYWTPASGYNYNYAGMTLNQGNGEIERLMHDAGLAVNMAYGCAVNGGSGALSSAIAPALLNNFGFVAATYGGFNIASLSNNAGQGYPVIVCGFDVTNHNEGHCWVCDGVTSATTYYCNDGVRASESFATLHMNWGWHEVNGQPDYNGWFSLTDWTVIALGQDFQYGNTQVTNIHP